MCYDHGMTTPKSWAVRGSGVIHQQFDGEGVVIDLDTGNYYSMPAAAGVLWQRLTAGAASAADLADELVAVFEVERSIALADATAFLGELEREKLVVDGAASAAAPGSPPAKNRAAYAPPRLEAFSELQDLLLLDPVHEVDPAVGWPRAIGTADEPRSAMVRLSGADVVAASVDATVVVVNRDRGIYCRLDGDAARAWRSIESGPTNLRGTAVVRHLLDGGFVEPAGESQAITATCEAAGDVSIHDELHEQIRPWGERRRPPRIAAKPGVEAICDRLDAWFEASAAAATTTDHSVAGHRITVTAPAGADAAALVAALPPAAADAAVEPALRVKVWRGEPAAAAPFVANLVASLKSSWGTLCGPRGEVVDLHTETTTAIFDPGGNVLSVVDRPRGRAWAVKIDDGPYPFWEVGAPLRFILHDHFSRHGLQVVHAAAVGDDRGAVLIVGKGGSGKSSTALAAAAHGLRYLGDDYCLVDPEGGTVHALYGTGKLVGAADVDRLAAYRGRSFNADSFERGGTDKGVFLVDEVCPGSLTATRQLRAIVLPRIDPGSASLGRAGSRGDALAAIFPSTVGQLPGAGPDDARNVERLVSSLPAFELLVGIDPHGVAEAMREILHTCSASA
jgi:hypothetical protein